jgi:hypothetical protein
MSTSSVTRQPRLSTCSETMPMASYSQIEIIAQGFISQLQNRSLFTALLGRVFFSTLLSHRSVSIPKLPHFFPSSTSLCGSESQFMVGPGSLTDGYPAPYPH